MDYCALTHPAEELHCAGGSALCRQPAVFFMSVGPVMRPGGLDRTVAVSTSRNEEDTSREISAAHPCRTYLRSHTPHIPTDLAHETINPPTPMM